MRFTRLDEFTAEQRHTYKEAVDIRLMEHGLITAGTAPLDHAHIRFLLGSEWRERIDADISLIAQNMWRAGHE